MSSAWDHSQGGTSKAAVRSFARGLCAYVTALAAAVMIGCAPTASQIAQTRAEQQWAGDFRKARQECIDHVPHACTRFENALAAQQAYTLYYYSKTIPGVSTPVFTPVTVPVAIGMPRFSGGMGGFR
jgi:hypothetical protein